MKTLPFLAPSLLATLVFALYFLPAGYVVAWLTNLGGFRRLAAPEKLLWSISLGLPVSTLLAVWMGHIGPRATVAVFALSLCVALGIYVQSLRKGVRQTATPRNPRRLLAPGVCLALVVLLVWFATCAVSTHGSLYEGVFTNDWYIRIPLEWSAGKGHVPPVNPFFTLGSQSTPLRYYYFFYVLCAAPMYVFGFSARSALIAGTAWAGVGFISVCWLCVKYLVQPSWFDAFASGVAKPSARRLALTFFGVSFITGLDLLPNLPSLIGHQPPYPSNYWWSLYGISSWPGFLPFIPHHFAGMAYGLLAYLLLTREPARTSTAVLAGLCLAALFGTSTFLAITVFLCVTVLGVDAAIRRDWLLCRSVFVSFCCMLLFDIPLLRELAFPALDALTAAAPAKSAASAGATGLPFVPQLLHWEHARWFVFDHTHATMRLASHHRSLAFAIAAFVVVVLYVVHWGFFGFVLWYQARADYKRPLPREGRFLWIFFLASSSIALFITSSPLQGGLNDLGRLASLIARVILLFWTASLVLSGWHRWRNGPPLSTLRSFGFLTAAVCACIGFAGTVNDVALERTYLWRADRGAIATKTPFEYAPGFGKIYAQFAEAWQTIDKTVPSDAVVQFNPNGLMQRPVLLYLNRRVAAGDISCETSFGGNKTLCEDRVVRPLLALYGQTDGTPARMIGPRTFQPGDFAKVCRDIGLQALLVDSTDPAWKEPSSWVWQEPALYAGGSVRVLRCP